MAVSSVDVFRTFWNGSGRKELPGVTVDEVSWVLNQPGSASISVDPLSPDALLILLNEVELQIWMNEHLRHYVVPRTLGGNLSQITFGCEGVLSWFHYATVTEVINNFSIDQLGLAAELVQWAQEQLNGDRNIDIGAYAPSGVFRARPTNPDDFPNVFDLLQEFPTLQNGFDFDVQLFDDGRREFWPYYPSRGQRKPQYALELDQRGRKYVKDLTNYKEDGVSQATDVYATGGTVTVDNPDPTPDSQLKVIGHFEDLGVNGSPRYGRMTKVISEGQIIDVGWLDDRAEAEESLRGQPIVTADPVVSEDLFGLIEPGDVLPMRVDYGRIQMMGDYRIMGITWRNSSKDLLLNMQPA